MLKSRLIHVDNMSIFVGQVQFMTITPSLSTDVSTKKALQIYERKS